MQQEKTDIKSMNLTELTAWVEALGEKKFRAKQIYEWRCRFRSLTVRENICSFCPTEM